MSTETVGATPQAMSAADLLDHIEEVRKYFESLREASLEDFCILVSPIIRLRSELESKRSHPNFVTQEERLYEPFFRLVQEITHELSICDRCYRGISTNRGGRNGGEERYVCSNPDCSTNRQ